MEVILIKDMENLGYANDIVNVKPGYANNYLIPQGYAKAATASAKKVLAENLKQRAHKDAKILADAQALAETIATLPLSLAVKAEEGKLFGTVTATDLAEALAAKGIRLSQLDVVMRLGTTEGIKGFVRNSDVLAIVSVTSVVDELRSGALRIIDIEGLTLSRDFNFVHAEAEPARLVRQFVDFARANR